MLEFFETLSLYQGSILVLSVFFATTAAVAIARRISVRRLRRRIETTGDALAELAALHFLAQPCSRCHESSMSLSSVSPNARSLAYECRHCGKKMRASASNETAHHAASLYQAFTDSVAKWNARHPLRHPLPDDADAPFEILFDTAPVALPYERLSRTPIPEAVRSEVWRRDEGRCVECGAPQNLEFDHIIPLVRGGATSTRNLQLLCRSCNASKADKI
ncbi:MAG: 5-methylcytosine-specific restriction endonuclease McrA [Hyphomicrobiaceae bacterium]